MKDTTVFVIIIAVVIGVFVTAIVVADRGEGRECKKFFETSKTSADSLRVVQIKPSCANRMK